MRHLRLIAVAAVLAISAAPVRALASNWVISHYVSPVDDSREAYAENPSLESAGDDVGAIVKMLAFCKDHRRGLILQAKAFWGMPIDADGYPVILRIDGAAPRRQTWREAKSLDAAFYLGDPVAFLRSLADRRTLFVRLTDPLGREHEATFSIDGASEAAAAISEACASDASTAKKAVTPAPSKKQKTNTDTPPMQLHPSNDE